MKLSNYAKQIGISYNTAWRMWKRGQLPGYQLPTGTVIVEPPAQKTRSTSFAARLYGRRRARRKTQQVLAALRA